MVSRVLCQFFDVHFDFKISKTVFLFFFKQNKLPVYWLFTDTNIPDTELRQRQVKRY